MAVVTAAIAYARLLAGGEMERVMRRMRAWRGRFAAVVVVGLVISVAGQAGPALGAGGPSVPGTKPAYNPPVFRGKLWKPRKIQATPSVGGHPLPANAGALARAALARRAPREPGGVAPRLYRAPARQWWPSGSGTAVLEQVVSVRVGRIVGTQSQLLSGQQQAGTLPVSVAAVSSRTRPASVSVAMASRRAAADAGVSGLVMRVAGSGSGPVTVRVNYARFAKNYGGSWGSRLKLVELPACAEWDPSAPACRVQLAVPTMNDGKGTVSARVDLGSLAAAVPPKAGQSARSLPALSGQAGNGMMLALVSSPGGAQGSYAATSLTSEGTWVVQNGGFGYRYPIALPPSLGGSAPSMTLSYSSQTIDGETSAQNPQGSQLGDGWTYSPGFIEQSFEPCSQDSSATSAEAGDQCWDGWNATISLAGHSGTLLGSGPGTWHLQNDDGTTIQLMTNGANGIGGPYSNEYWVVTTTDGTQYYFGSGHVPGDNSSSLTTNSAWNVPVYCPNSNDPCNSSSSGASSWAQLPYRWNLDYVVDPENNLTVYHYKTETNYYMRDGSTGAGTLTSYIRDGYLTDFEYGWKLADATASPVVLPADKVVISPSARCTAASCTTVNSANYPDVPTDQICASGSTSCDNASPTFFSEQRTTSITTKVLASQSSGTYNNADTWALAQSFLTGTGQTTAVMSLTSITRTGQDGTTALPLSTKFSVTMMDNRVSGTSQPKLWRPRITGITTEAGESIAVTYNAPACTQGSGGNITNSDAPNNDLACYPEYWAPPGDPDSMDWFNEYTVSAVAQSDGTGIGSPAHVTSYTYLGGAAWHQDENPALPSAWRTWDVFRGYLKVETTTGVAPDPVTETMTWYMRGMYGDANGSGGTTTTQVTDSVQDSYKDYDYLAGQVLETDTYTRAGGSPDSEQLEGPWTYNQTASMTPPSGSGLGSLTANMLAQGQTRTTRLLASGSWQTNTSTTYFNGDGQPAVLDDAPAGLTELCSTTSYAVSSGNPMMENYPDQVTTVAGSAANGKCPAAGSSNIISDTKTYYDDESASITATSSSLGTWGTVASPGGLATGVAKASSWPSTGGEAWLPESATEYDGYGRVTYRANANGNATTTSYSPAAGQLPTSRTVRNAMKWKSVTTLDQGRQLPLTVTDPNGAVTTETYDGLGRLTSVTLPLDQGYKPTYTYAYAITGTSPPAITTGRLLETGGYAYDIKIYDGMLQFVQEQMPTSNGAAGRLISNISYNSDGWQASATNSPFYDKSASPSTSWYSATPDEIPSLTADSFDGQGRVVSAAQWADGHYQWQTTDAYPGMDTTTVTPPSGGTTTTLVTNSIGQKSQSSLVGNSSGATDTTGYSYSRAGLLATLADNNGNAWTYHYNLLGQKITSTDPGMIGTTDYAYDADGNLLSTTDPDGTALTYKYDALDRRTATFNSTPGLAGEPVELDSWAYDQTPLTGGTGPDALGQLTSATSYDANGQQYAETVTGYDISYQITGTSVSVPSDAGALASGSNSTKYLTASAFTTRTGLSEYTEYSADGGLIPETVQNTYDTAGLLTEFGDATYYLDDVSYSPTGQIMSTTFGPSPHQLVQDYTYDGATSRMLQSITNLQNLSGGPADVTDYTYNQAGDVTSTSDTQNSGGTEAQCYAYNTSGNELDELTAAWTDTGGTTATSDGANLPPGGLGGCNNTSPSAGNIGGPASYWETFTYDLLGDRTSGTSYNTSLPASQDTLANATTQEIAYSGGNLSNSPTSNAPATSEPQPDIATSIVTTSPGGTTTTTPTYNSDGQEVQVTSASTGAKPPASPDNFSGITYNAQGQVASVTVGAHTATYFYDAGGNLLLRTDTDGTSTLYLDGGTEQITASGSSLSGVRILAAPDGTAVVRSSTGTISYTTINQLHTAQEAIDGSSLAVTRRYYDPWGDPVGTAPGSWPDDLGYVGKPADSGTGLDLVGARQYNPVTGSFTSLDPDLEEGSPQQMGGYTYAGDNPATFSDPSGRYMTCGDGNPCPPIPPPPPPAPESPAPPPALAPLWAHVVPYVPQFTFPVAKAGPFVVELPFATCKITIEAAVTTSIGDSRVELDFIDHENPVLRLHGPRGSELDITANLVKDEKDAAEQLYANSGPESRFKDPTASQTFTTRVNGTEFDVNVSVTGEGVDLDIWAVKDLPDSAGTLHADIEITPREKAPVPAYLKSWWETMYPLAQAGALGVLDIVRQLLKPPPICTEDPAVCLVGADG
jgi:RHS repeat-associated protein